MKLLFAKKEKITVSQAKRKAWKTFSEYIRTRDCLKTTGKRFVGLCVTCGRGYGFKELQAGHWLPGRHSSVLFNERNAHAQCYSCNVMLKSNPIKYFHFMEKTYTKEEMHGLELLDAIPKQFKVPELVATQKYYQEKLNNLIKE